MTSPPSRCHHCADFTRAQMLSHGVASAGRGLPQIELGMPTPAGSGLSRRSFLARTAGLSLTVFGAAALGPRAFEAGIASASAASSSSPILVSIWLGGGLDPLELLAPVNDPTYQSLRPSLKHAPSPNPLDVFTEDTSLQWHPNASPIRDLHRAGKVTVMLGIGYGTDQMSHFVSRHYWEVGELNDQAERGWLGRYLDAYGTADNPLQGLSLDTYLSPVLAPATAPVATIQYPESYWVGVKGVSTPNLVNGFFQTAEALGQLTPPDAATGEANVALTSMLGVDSELQPIQEVQPAPAGGAQYPGGYFSGRLAILAEMIGQGYPLQCVTIPGPGGYDTHGNQGPTIENNLSVLSNSLAAFQQDLEGRGVADRVLVHVWSEFGRRAYDNGSGTDHGAAGVSLLIGTRASGQMVGEFPGLASLDPFGNLLTTVDYRAVYCSLLEQWFGADPVGIITNAGQFARPTLLKA